MTNNCNVARDLMPLVIDGVASEESQQYVGEHIAECTECALTYGAMRVELPRANQEKERAEMEKAAKAMKKKRRKRMLWAVAIGAALSIVLLVCVNRLYTNLFVIMNVLVETDAYEASVYRLQDDRVVLLFDQVDDQLITARGMSSGNGVVKVHLYNSRVPQFTDAERNEGGYRMWLVGEWKDGYLMDERQQIDKIYASGNISETLVYSHGDEIAEASSELNRYIQEKNDPANWKREDYEAWLEKLRKTVPEMQ